jgi:hypothetical protein
MPCYLVTYHAYGSWLPDRKQGYVKRKQGLLARDAKAATQYRNAMKESIVSFTSAIQSSIIDAILGSQTKQQFEPYFIATDKTHVHVLIAWRNDRTWLQLRSRVKGSISRRLKRECGERTWLLEGASRKRVKDRAHFEYLVSRYLPRHRGCKWCPERGVFR